MEPPKLARFGWGRLAAGCEAPNKGCADDDWAPKSPLEGADTGLDAPNREPDDTPNRELDDAPNIDDPVGPPSRGAAADDWGVLPCAGMEAPLKGDTRVPAVATVGVELEPNSVDAVAAGAACVSAELVPPKLAPAPLPKSPPPAGAAPKREVPAYAPLLAPKSPPPVLLPPKRELPLLDTAVLPKPKLAV